MSKLKHLIGKVISNPSEEWKGMEGINFLITLVQIENGPEEFMVLRPIVLDEMEKFYKLSFERALKEFISDDYDYCLWYVLNEDCEITCEIDKKNLEDIREVTEEDIQEHNKNLDEFKKIHKVYEYQQKLDEEEKAEQLAVEEFKNAEKIKIEVRTKDGTTEVEAVIYKGFGIHNLLGWEVSITKAITILEGDFKGIQMAKCSILNYKQIIDEVREAIGDRAIVQADSEKVREILKKY